MRHIIRQTENNLQMTDDLFVSSLLWAMQLHTPHATSPIRTQEANDRRWVGNMNNPIIQESPSSSMTYPNESLIISEARVCTWSLLILFSHPTLEMPRKQWVSNSHATEVLTLVEPCFSALQWSGSHSDYIHLGFQEKTSVGSASDALEVWKLSLASEMEIFLLSCDHFQQYSMQPWPIIQPIRTSDSSLERGCQSVDMGATWLELSFRRQLGWPDLD